MTALRRIAVAGLIAGLMLVLVGYVVPQLPPVQQWLARTIAAALGPGVEIEGSRLRFYPMPSLNLSGAEIIDPSGRVRQKILIAEEVRLGLAIRPLLEGELSLASFRITSPKLVIEPAHDGSFPVGEIIGNLISAEPETPLELAASEELSQVAKGLTPYDVPIELRDAEIQIKPTTSQRPIVVRLKHIGGSIERKPADPAVRFSFASHTAGDGAIALEGAYGLPDAPGSLHLTLSVTQVPRDQLFAETPDGVAVYNLDADLRCSVGDTVAFLDSMEGTGTLLLRGGTVSATALGGRIWNALLAIVPGVSPDASYGAREQPTQIDHVSAEFQVAGGSIAFRNIAFFTDDYVVRGEGRVGRDLQLAMRIDVAMTPSGLTKLLVISKLPLPTGPLKTLPPVPMRVSGSVGSPIVTARVRSLPLATAGYVFHKTVDGGAKKILRRTDEAFKAGRKGLRDLLESD